MKLKLTSSAVSAASAWGMTLYGALLPFHALGTWPARRWTVLEPCELALLAAAPAVLLELVQRRRRLLGSWIVRGVVLLTGFGVLAELLSPRASRLALLEELLGLLAVGGMASALWGGHGRQVLRGVLVGGVVALAIGVVGYALALATGFTPSGAFVFSSAHPLFPGGPRMTGTLGRHAVWLGEYCVMLLSVALAVDARIGARKLRVGAGLLSAVGLLGSMSFAWLGGLLLALRGWFTSRARASAPRFFSRACAGLVLLAYASASYWMLVGAPVDPQKHAVARSCRELDGAHHVLRRGPAFGVCQPVLGAGPYPHRVTLYALSHQTSWHSFTEHPLLGGGRAAYGAFARAHAARVHALGPVGYYQKPVGLLAATLAYTGLAGALALLVTLYGVWRARPATSERARSWVFYGALALILCGTQTDMELRGPLWVLLGLLAGSSEERSRAPVAASGPPE